MIENLKLSPLLYAMMRILGKVFEIFKVAPKRFTRFLLELHDVHPNESDFVNRVEFLQEDLDEIISRCDRINH